MKILKSIFIEMMVIYKWLGQWSEQNVDLAIHMVKDGVINTND